MIHSVNCQICSSSIEYSYRLMCKHCFCEVCIREHIISSEETKLTCPDSTCRKPMYLVDLEALLPPEDLKELFLRQKLTFLQANQDKFKECPTPDCENILCSPDIQDATHSHTSIFSKGLVFCDSCGNDYCFKCLKNHYDSDCSGNKLKEVYTLIILGSCSGEHHDEEVSRLPKRGKGSKQREGALQSLQDDLLRHMSDQSRQEC